jgi:hypothetical protein
MTARRVGQRRHLLGPRRAVHRHRHWPGRCRWRVCDHQHLDDQRLRHLRELEMQLRCQHDNQEDDHDGPPLVVSARPFELSSGRPWQSSCAGDYRPHRLEDPVRAMLPDSPCPARARPGLGRRLAASQLQQLLERRHLKAAGRPAIRAPVRAHFACDPLSVVGPVRQSPASRQRICIIRRSKSGRRIICFSARAVSSR